MPVAMDLCFGANKIIITNLRTPTSIKDNKIHTIYNSDVNNYSLVSQAHGTDMTRT